jgi:hypothetical protein
MKNTTRRIAPFLFAGTAALAIGVAPAAAAETHLDCVYQGTGNSQCESPGNAQLTATPPNVSYPQQYPFLLDGPILLHHFGAHGHR